MATEKTKKLDLRKRTVKVLNVRVRTSVRAGGYTNHNQRRIRTGVKSGALPNHNQTVV